MKSPRENIDQAEPRLLVALDRFQIIAAVFTLALGLTVLLGGWMVGIDFLKSIIPGQVSMKPNTALGFILAGISLGLLRSPASSARARWGRILGAALALLGAATIAEYLTGWNLGIDDLLFADTGAFYTTHPGRMAFNTALAWVFTGAALVFLNTARAEWLGLAALLTTLMALAGYLYGPQGFVGLFSYTGMAVHTVCGLLALNLGILAARPQRGVMAWFSSSSTHGHFLRRLVPGGLAVIIGGSLLIQLGFRMGFYESQARAALDVVPPLVLLGVILRWTSLRMARAEADRRLSMHALRESEQFLRQVIDAVPHAIFAKDFHGRFLLVNRSLAALNALTPEEMTGRTELELAQNPAQAEAFLRDDREVIRSGGIKVIADEYLTDAAGRTHTLRTTKIPFSFPTTGEAAVLGVIENITEQRKAETQLRLHAAALEAAANGIAITDRAGVILWANAALSRMTGYRLDEMVGRDPSLFKSGRQDAAFYRRMWETIGRGDTWQGELVNRRKDGTLYHEEMSITPLPDKSGAVTQFIAIKQDITARHDIEATLRINERDLRLVADNAPALISYIDNQFRYRRVNKVWEEWIGQPASAVVGRTVREVLGDPNWEVVRPHMEQALAGRVPRFESEFHFRGTDPRWVHLTYTPELDESGHVLGFVSHVMDISARREAERALDEARRRFEGIISSAMDAIISIDEEQRILVFNAAAEEMFQCRASEALCSTISRFIPERFREVYAGHVGAFGARHSPGQPVTARRDALYALRADGEEFPIEASISQVELGGRRLFTVVVRDQTERKRAEEALLAAHTTLQRQNELLEERVAERTKSLRAAILELENWSYSIAHDMRAPLRAMQGFSRILLEDHAPHLDETGRDYLKRISDAAVRLDQLIRDLLNYSKLVHSDLPLGVVGLNPLLEQILTSYPNLQPPIADVVVRHPLPSVRANPAALTQVISNLLGNAVKFVPEGIPPRVIVRADAAPGSDGMVRLWFEDNGIGIGKEHHDRIFGMFQRLHPTGRFEGTGMGLTIVRTAIERMGGRVGVESEPGRGSRFWIELKKA